MFDLSSFYANAKYLTPEQRNDASANGFFNAATQFLAPQPQGASPLYTLAKGLSGYTQGVADYGNSIPTQDKAWQDYETRKQLQSFYTPDKLSEISNKYGIQSRLTPEQAQKLDMEVAAKNATRDPMDDKLKAAQINAYNASASQKGASNAGGATGELVDRYMRATGASFPEALQAIQTGYRQNMLLGPDGTIAPIAGAADATAALAQGKKAGQLTAEQNNTVTKNNISAASVDDIINEAKPYVEKSPGGAYGLLSGKGKTAIGMSDEQTQANAKLSAIGGKLVMAMPRMEGPQSDKDALLYRQMAAEIGDPYVPPGDKLAAMQSIQELNAKYAARGGKPYDQGKGLPPADGGGWSATRVK